MADLVMEVDAALGEVPVNILPLIDDTDFKSRETAVAYNAAGMDLVWNFVTAAGAYTQTAVTPTSGGTYDWTHQGDGMYTIEIPASGGASINNASTGFGWFTGVATGVLPWRGPTIQFSPANVVNAMVNGNDKLQVHADEITAGLITAAAIAADAITDAKVASDVTIASVTGAVGSVTGNVGGNVTGSVGSVATGGITSGSFAAGAINAVAIAADAITDAKVASDVTIASVTGAVGSVTGNVGGNVAGSVASVTGNVGGNVVGSVGSVTTVSDKTGYRLSATGVDDILDEVVEGTTTLRESTRLANTANGGKTSGAATTTFTARDLADSKNRLSVTVDADGNRSAVTRDLT